MGEYFGKTNKELMGYIKSISYAVDNSSTYETEVGFRVPKHITATITYKIIHGTVPELHKNGKTSLDAGDNEIDAYEYYGYSTEPAEPEEDDDDFF